MPHTSGPRLPILAGTLALILVSCTSGSDQSGSGGAPRAPISEPTELARSDAGVPAAPSTTSSVPATTSTTRDDPLLSDAVVTALSDMYGPPTRDIAQGWGPPWGAHDAAIDVNPAYDFAGGARPAEWNEPSGLHVQPWCEAFRAAGGTPVTDFRIEFRSYEYWELTEGTWELVFSSDEAEVGFDGFWGNANVRSIGDAALSDEGEGVWSVDWRPDAAMLHPWTRTRVPTSSAVEARVGRAQIRLAPGEDPSIDLDGARVLGACTFDYYQNATGGEGQEIAGAVVPRHKYVTTDWQWFNTITLPGSLPDNSWSLEAIHEEVSKNPPPLS